MEDCKRFESNNKSIALNVLYIPHNTEKIRLAYKLKYNHKHENQVVLLMITDGKKWHYLALKCGPSDDKKWYNLAEKSLSRLFRGITSKNNGDLICLNCFHYYRTKGTLKEHKKVCNDHDYCYPEMPNKYNKILKYNHAKSY